jgi:hypothetical protein
LLRSSSSGLQSSGHGVFLWSLIPVFLACLGIVLWWWCMCPWITSSLVCKNDSRERREGSLCLLLLTSSHLCPIVVAGFAMAYWWAIWIHLWAINHIDSFFNSVYWYCKREKVFLVPQLCKTQA